MQRSRGLEQDWGGVRSWRRGADGGEEVGVALVSLAYVFS